MSAFETATAVTATAVPGVYDAELHPDWAIHTKPNGGYLLAILARAACDVVDTETPLAVSAHYMRAPDVGPAEIRAEAIRRGRRVSTSRAAIWQNDKPCIEALVSSGPLENAEVDYLSAPPPVIPPPEECVSSETEKFTVELFRNVELLMSPETVPLPTPNGTPTLQFWFRFRDGTDPDVMSLLLAVDAHPPTIFHLKKYGWAPTVE
ncbi:MAG: thioesterase family protein, partial [Frankiaceae bacterium]|nr:thioesterase family protein [Frankiaceae bacterium]